eukprot:606884-Prorocentrum_minimum.AAC.1
MATRSRTCRLRCVMNGCSVPARDRATCTTRATRNGGGSGCANLARLCMCVCVFARRSSKPSRSGWPPAALITKREREYKYTRSGH